MSAASNNDSLEVISSERDRDPSPDSGAGNGRNQKSGQTADTELGLLVDDNIFQQTSAATVGTASRVSTLLLDRESEGIRMNHCIAMFTLCSYLQYNTRISVPLDRSIIFNYLPNIDA